MLMRSIQNDNNDDETDAAIWHQHDNKINVAMLAMLIDIMSMMITMMMIS